MSIGAKSVIKLYIILLKALENKYNECVKDRVSTFFEEWRKRSAIIYGKEPSEIRFLSIKIEHPDLFLYALHTYYTILVKCLGACIVGVYLGYDIALELIRRGPDALREIEIEGKPFKQYGILNLIEPDIYSWYLIDKDKTHEEFENEMSEVISGIGRVLETYNFKFIKPTRDILKRLYQNIIPRDIRRGLGEFYTPDWLAQYILDKVEFMGEIDSRELEKAVQRGDYSIIKSIRLLDPACGSGTFLFHAILKVLEVNDKLVKEKPHIIAKAITENIVGFDISPLAVITSKVTYLLALSPILKHIGEVRIPIYETDSILVPEGKYISLIGEELRISVPLPNNVKKDLEEKGKFPGILLPSRAIEDIKSLEEFMKCLHELLQYLNDKTQFNKLLKEYANKFPENILSNNINIITILREYGRDKIWLSMLKNWIIPLIIMKRPFKYVVGNPPWINVSNMPKEYGNILHTIFEKYELVPRGSTAAMLEFAILFIYVSANRFLENGGMLGMLITKRVFEGGHGALFRRFTILAEKDNEIPLKVIECHDMLEIRPFHKDVKNEPGAIVLRKGEKTEQFKYIIWHGRKVSAKDEWEPKLEEVLKDTKRHEVTMILKQITRQIGRITAYEYVFTPANKYTDAILKPGNPYHDAHNGAQLAPREIILLEPHEVQLLSNGSCRIKEKYVVECDYVYYAITGDSISKWLIKNFKRAIIPYKKDGSFLGDELLNKRVWSNYYGLDEILGIRVSRRIGWENENESVREIIEYGEQLARKNELNIASKIIERFGSKIVLLYKLLRMTEAFKSIKVVWIDISDKFNAVVVAEVNERPILPDVTTGYVNVINKDEAHYICAILNSTPINYVAQRISPKHHHPRVFKSIYVPKYDPNNPIHLLLSTCSYLAHDFAYKSYHEGIKVLDNYLKKVEELIDVLVEALYNLKIIDINDIINQLLSITNEVKGEGVMLTDDVNKKVIELLNKAQTPPDNIKKQENNNAHLLTLDRWF